MCKEHSVEARGNPEDQENTHLLLKLIRNWQHLQESNLWQISWSKTRFQGSWPERKRKRTDLRVDPIVLGAGGWCMVLEEPSGEHMYSLKTSFTAAESVGLFIWGDQGTRKRLAWSRSHSWIFLLSQKLPKWLGFSLPDLIKSRRNNRRNCATRLNGEWEKLRQLFFRFGAFENVLVEAVRVLNQETWE